MGAWWEDPIEGGVQETALLPLAVLLRERRRAGAGRATQQQVVEDAGKVLVRVVVWQGVHLQLVQTRLRQSRKENNAVRGALLQHVVTHVVVALVVAADQL